MISLSEFTQYFTIYVFFVILIIGFVGNSFNIITLATKNFRTQASIFYLLWSTVLSQIFITVGIIFRFATEYFGNNLINTDRTICKVRNYLLICLPFMSTMCVFLASFDRCIATSLNARWRQLSSITVAHRITPASVILVALSSFFFNFVFDIYNGKCIPSAGIGLHMVNIYGILFATLFPICGMCVCAILTWINFKKSRNRIDTLSNTTSLSQQQRRMNRQVIILTSVQTLMTIIVYTIRSSTYTYTFISASVPKSVQQQHIEYLILQVSIMLIYTNHGVVFYLNYIFSTTFRRTFHSSVRLSIGKFF